MKIAAEENARREALMKQHFADAVHKEADLWGCDRKCFCGSVDAGHNLGQIFVDCCNDGIVRVDFATVNTAAVVENVYGDVQNLSEEDVATINQSLKHF
jgi:hypothetical protein